MESKLALDAFQALAQETRLAALRLLVQAGPNGISAGAIAEQLGVQPSTLSTHLAILERAGLVAARREARHIYYAAQYEGLRRLIAFLMEDCCQGRPEICGGLGSAAASTCAPAAAKRAAISPKR
ncbi:MAG: winged helix-turn-helix transcriptional regulator [Rhodospirillaceae bacterium]|nr:winged helix-turn-helix transcriptional regulator [Rhodospirillaceae bacterium]